MGRHRRRILASVRVLVFEPHPLDSQPVTGGAASLCPTTAGETANAGQ